MLVGDDGGVKDEVRLLLALRRAKDRMDREYAEPLDVPALAATAYLSPSHFARQFRAAFGESPYAYLMTRRIERAMTLLRTTDLSVTDICMAVGCTSLGSFSSRFREVVGVSPSAYRGQHRDDVDGYVEGELDQLGPCLAMQAGRPRRTRLP